MAKKGRIILEVKPEQSYKDATSLILNHLIEGAKEVALDYLKQIHGGVKKQGYRQMKDLQGVSRLSEVASKGKHPEVKYVIDGTFVAFSGTPRQES